MSTIDELETEVRHLNRELLMCRQDQDESAQPLLPATTTVGRTTVGLRAAEDAWGVHEPPGERGGSIDQFIRGPYGLGWSWLEPYKRNGQFAWCGAFMAWCFGQAGLRADIRKFACASTYRLHTWIRQGRAIRSLAASPLHREVALEQLQPGDVLIVGRAGSEYGEHITIVREAPSPHTDDPVKTWEGNARGVGPDNTRYEGVVQQVRPMTASDSATYRALWAFRWAAEDFA